MKKFELYIANPSQRAIRTANKYPYHTITADYILVYTDANRPNGFCQTESKKLCARDTEWVDACNDQIIKDIVETNGDIANRMMVFLAEFQKALEEEAQKINEGAARNENKLSNHA